MAGKPHTTTPACKYCGTSRNAPGTRPLTRTPENWHDTAECVAAQEPSERMGGPR